jgi:hypothetical protein
MGKFVSTRGGLRRWEAFWWISLPVVVSLLVRAMSVLEWPRCPGDGTCAEVADSVSMLGAAFPHVLGYPVEVMAGSWVLPFLVALDVAMGLLLWRWLPLQVGWATVISAWGIWVALAVLSVLWGAPLAVIWTAQALS